MNRGKSRKPEPWRLIIGLCSIALIVYMWVKKDIAALYANMLKEELLPLLGTTLLVSLFKVAAVAGAILLVKWIAAKLFKKKAL